MRSSTLNRKGFITEHHQSLRAIAVRNILNFLCVNRFGNVAVHSAQHEVEVENRNGGIISAVEFR